MSLEQLWNGWRAEYIRGAVAGSTSGASVFTSILTSGLSDEDAHIVQRGALTFAIMNAFPYASGHVLVLPYREVANLEDLTVAEAAELWSMVTAATLALRASHAPHAINVGINLGPAAGGSVSQHLHVHVVPRWDGDTNFMTVIANTRTLPEALEESARRIRNAWPDEQQKR
ncbi:MAG: HIT domain-containing protein [Actinobacteria bacterium]|nr:HIT domain-containing protein [Actinomycetota bacterium]